VKGIRRPAGPGRLLRLPGPGPSPAGNGAAVSPSPLVQFSGPTHAPLMEPPARHPAKAHEQAHDHTPGARATSSEAPLSDDFFTRISADSPAPYARWHVTDARTRRAARPIGRGQHEPGRRRTHNRTRTTTSRRALPTPVRHPADGARAPLRAGANGRRRPPRTAHGRRTEAARGGVREALGGGRPPPRERELAGVRGVPPRRRSGDRLYTAPPRSSTSRAALRTYTIPAIPSGAP
jgi:hypothetical protein